MRVISFVATKGGVGKTTLSYQFGNYLAKEKNKKVLFLDFDSQKSLSGMYTTNNSYNTGDILLNNDNVSILNVDKNIDLIPATVHLNNHIITSISSKANKELLLFMWILRNKEQLDYDYIIIDTNPAWNLITMNVVSASDLVISPLEPSRFGFESKGKILTGVNELKKAVINPISQESYVIADIYFIGNLIKHNTASSRDFIKKIEDDNDVIGLINEKEILNTSMLERKYFYEYIKEQNKEKKEEKIIKQVFNVFDKIIEI